MDSNELGEGRLIQPDAHRSYRLQTRLGGGLTSQVYLAVNEADDTEQIAVKIARPALDPRLTASFKSEADLLARLAQAERNRTRYFPRVIFFKNDYYAQGGKWLLLGLELITAPSLADCVWREPNMLARERLTAQAGVEYARMLTLLHNTGTTCADRKLKDIHWHGAANEGQQLRVLDWNVTAQSTTQTLQFDLFRFGLLWYQLLLETEPQVIKSDETTLVITRPSGAALEKWEQLSEGMRHVIETTLHPNLKLRYPGAELLKQAFQEHWERWQKTPDELVRAARNASNPGAGDFYAVDLAKRRHELLGDPLSEQVDDLYARLHELVKGQWDKLADTVRDALTGGDSKIEPDALALFLQDETALAASDPVMALRLKRYSIMLEARQAAEDADG